MSEPNPIAQLVDVRDAMHSSRRALQAVTVPADDAGLREDISAARHHLMLGARRLQDALTRGTNGVGPLTPGQHLRAYREAAGLTREEVALGLFTEPDRITVMSRAELVQLIEDGVEPMSPDLLGELYVLIADIGAALADRAALPKASAAA